jgi:hypothetical protein
MSLWEWFLFLAILYFMCIGYKLVAILGRIERRLELADYDRKRREEHAP